MKKILTGIFTIILIFLIELLIISFSAKEICINTISDSVVKNEVSSKVLDEVTKELSDVKYEDLVKIELATKNNEAINKITDKYFDSMIDSIVNNSDIIVPDTKEELNKIINDNIEVLDKLNINITEQQKDLVIEKLTGENNKIEKIYINVANSLKNSLTKEQEEIANVYSTFSSNKFKYILVGLIILFILLIAVIKKSWYKWIINVSIASMVCGITTALIIPKISDDLSSEITNRVLGRSASINVNNLTNLGYIILGIGIVALIIYLIINFIIKKNKKAS